MKKFPGLCDRCGIPRCQGPKCSDEADLERIEGLEEELATERKECDEMAKALEGLWQVLPFPLAWPNGEMKIVGRAKSLFVAHRTRRKKPV